MLSLVSQEVLHKHIGAYGVTLDNGQKKSFLIHQDTEPLLLCVRVVQVTDIAIIVIAADDIMPQTKEE
jgi:translation initiation factor IF-2